jgi:hypothetical protein
MILLPASNLDAVYFARALAERATVTEARAIWGLDPLGQVDQLTVLFSADAIINMARQQIPAPKGPGAGKRNAGGRSFSNEINLLSSETAANSWPVALGAHCTLGHSPSRPAAVRLPARGACSDGRDSDSEEPFR